ncbi:MAG: response regulator [Candidatus Acidiferrales bacterium]
MPRILVADDNTNIQKMVTLAFQERGVEVIAVGNGEAAVRRMPDANPDLVLADVFMPVRNGYEVCEFVKKDTRFAHVPVILLVGAFDPLDEKEARRVGADGVLKKPFVPPDPLIAMVMSALEKNPRVAAELAKAKEVVAVVETALPAAALENPAMAEPKPLPEFPEPTPEEAAVIYGFGKGVRAMDLDEEEVAEEEPRAKKKSKEAPAPKAPAKNEKAPKIATGPKTQVAVPDDEDDEVEGDFDSAATASDWRRNAADFEVPENVESNPVYSYGQNFEPITFPSEKDVPPKRVRVEEKSDDAASAAKNAAPEAVSQAVAPASYEPVVDEPEPVVEAARESVVAHEEPAVAAKISEPDVAAAPAGFFKEPETKEPVGTQQAAAQQEEVHEPAPRPSFVSRVRGWMDMMSPSHTEESSESGDHWMNKIAEPPAAERAAAPESAAAAPAAEAEPIAPVEIAARVDYAAEVPVEVQEASASAGEPASGAAEAVEATSYESVEAKAEEEPRAFGESQFGESGLGGSSYHFSDVAHSGSHEAVADDAVDERHEEADAQTDAHAEVAAREETRHEEPAVEVAAPAEPFAAEPEPVTSSAADFSPELMVAPADAPRNGDLAAEHKPSEPWLVNEEHHEPSDYFASLEQAQQADVREQEIRAESPVVDPPFASEAREEYWDREAETHAESELAAAPNSLFADPAPSAVEQEFFQRVPTLPPPNREALSDIPFLMPPPPSAPADSFAQAGATNSDTVDEVVRKVLEKLQPQLQELLSQGVKPLVENLLQNELHKKEK